LWMKVFCNVKYFNNSARLEFNVFETRYRLWIDFTSRNFLLVY